MWKEEESVRRCGKILEEEGRRIILPLTDYRLTMENLYVFSYNYEKNAYMCVCVRTCDLFISVLVCCSAFGVLCVSVCMLQVHQHLSVWTHFSVPVYFITSMIT